MRRAPGATGLGKIATATAVEVLIRALSDYDLKVQVAAVSALARAGQRVIPRLLVTLKSPTPELRSRSAQALGGIADTSTNGGLIAALKDVDSAFGGMQRLRLDSRTTQALFSRLSQLLGR